jgi:hypothetical protein
MAGKQGREMNSFLQSYALFVFGHERFGFHPLNMLAVISVTVTVTVCLFSVKLYRPGPWLAMRCLGVIWAIGSIVLQWLAQDALT